MKKKLIILMLFIGLCNQTQGQELRVIDGDTLKLDNRKIRLLGIDAPELPQLCVDAKSNKNWSCGEVAKAFIEGMVEGRDVRCITESIDRYKRCNYLPCCCFISK